MKELLLYTVVTVAALITIAVGDDRPITPIPTECPKKDPLNSTVHLAHESNCTLFYMCHEGRKFLKICPLRDDEGNRLHFNPLLQVCDWPDVAGCTSEVDTTESPSTTTKKPTKPTTTTNPTTPTEEPATSTNPPTTTEKLTTTTKPTTTTEEPATSTNPPTTTEKLTTTTKPTTTTTEEPATSTNPPTTTEKLTTTTKPTTTTTEEPATSTNPTTTTENPATTSSTTTELGTSSADDSDYTISDYSTNNTPTEVECSTELLSGSKSIQVRHESDCRLYYTCENGRKVLKECDEGLYYNELLEMCDWETEDSCLSS